MTKKKTTYLSPETELLVVRIGENFCGTGIINQNGSEQGRSRGGDGETDFVFE